MYFACLILSVPERFCIAGVCSRPLKCCRRNPWSYGNAFSFSIKNSPRFCWVVNFENGNFSSVLSCFPQKKLAVDFQTNWSWLFLCPKAHLHLCSRAGNAEESQLQTHRWDLLLQRGLCWVLEVSRARVGWSGLSCHVRLLQVWRPALAGWDIVEMKRKRGWCSLQSSDLQSSPLLLSPGGLPLVPSATPYMAALYGHHLVWPDIGRDGSNAE